MWGHKNLRPPWITHLGGASAGRAPPEEAERKRRDTGLLRELSGITKRGMPECFERYPRELTAKVLTRGNVMEYIEKFGKVAGGGA